MVEYFSEEDKKGLIYAVILVGTFLLIVVAVAIGYFTGSKGYDKESLCEFDVERPEHHVLLVDTTDVLGVFHADFIEKNTLNLIADSPMGSRFTVYLIEERAGGLSGVEFNMCKPNSGENMNPIYENHKLAQRKFRERFQQPFIGLLDKLREKKEQQQSPIVESISDMFKLSIFDPSSKKVTLSIYSDLLQNSSHASVYTGTSLPKTASCESRKNLDEILAYILERDGKANSYQDESLLTDWANYLGHCTKHLQFEKVRF